MKKINKRIIAICLTLVLAAVMFIAAPAAVLAAPIVSSTPISFVVGVSGSFEFTSDLTSGGDLSVTDSTLPTGVTASGSGDAITLSGTPAAGTAGGTYSISIIDYGDTAPTPTTFPITVDGATQTIVSIATPIEMTRSGAAFILTPQRINDGGGTQINNGGANQPVLAFAVISGTSVTVGPTTGLVTIDGLGSSTITVSSPAVSGYYAAATSVNVIVNVVANLPTLALSGTPPSGTAGSIGAQTITVTVSNSYNEPINFTCEIGSISETGTRSGDGDVSFNFSATDLNSLAAGSYQINVSSAATTNNSAVGPIQVGTLNLTAATPTITITGQPAATTNVPFRNITNETLSVSANVVPSAALTYQWYCNTSPSTTTPTPISLSGATSASLSLGSEANLAALPKGQTLYYYCVVSSSGATPVTSSFAAVKTIEPAFVSAPTTITDTSADQLFVINGNFDDFSYGNASAPGGSGYQITLNKVPLTVANDGTLSGFPAGSTAKMGTITPGSVNITLTGAYLATLPDGTYVFVVSFGNGTTIYATPSATFVINRGGGAGGPTVAGRGTGDFTNLTGLWIAMAIAALGALYLVWRYRRQYRSQEKS